MKKIFKIAEREFLATAGTKAFIFATLITPAMLSMLIVLMPRLMNESAPKIEGEIAVFDPTGLVAEGLKTYLTPEKIAARRREEFREMKENLPVALGGGGGVSPSQTAMDEAFTSALGEAPHLDVVILSPGSDLEAAKSPLKAVSKAVPGVRDRLAVLVVHPDAVVKAAGGEKFGSYDFFVRSKLDSRIAGEITDGMKDAIVAARVRLSGLDPGQFEQVAKVDRVKSRTVTAMGENETNRVLNEVMPAVFMALLLVSVMMSGQYLLTTTVEEKASRVVEVLLSAVSPMELMVGKILGQLAVGLLVLVLYLGLGVMALMSFASLDLLDPMLIVFLLVFYLLAYFTVGALMAAIGSAVNEMREAQGLMTPVMLIIMIPWILWLPISRDPNSTFAVVLSFLPPVSNFVMMLRMASATPPPIWQPLLGIVVGAAGCYGALVVAAKIFRIGLLMYGKPPDFATLVRWARSG